MFLKKKRPSPPPVEQEEQFVEWLLRYGKEFEVYRKIYKSNIDGYVRINKEAVLKELRDHSIFSAAVQRYSA